LKFYPISPHLKKNVEKFFRKIVRLDVQRSIFLFGGEL